MDRVDQVRFAIRLNKFTLRWNTSRMTATLESMLAYTGHLSLPQQNRRFQS